MAKQSRWGEGQLFWKAELPGQTGPPRKICRLGLATRGNTELTTADVLHALDQGIDFLNWCGVPNGPSRAIGELGRRRSEVVVCVQLEARTASEAQTELDAMLRELQTDYVDALAFYYVEAASEWEQIIAPGGALEYCLTARGQGKVRLLGLTSHQRPLAAACAQTGLLDFLMIRYNAAHRGAETEVFPITQALGLPVVVYTCLRWGALLHSTADDPLHFEVPRAPGWYRFGLHHPGVTVALMAPHNRAELDEDLTVLQAGPLAAEEYERLAAHGRRVRRHAGGFP